MAKDRDKKPNDRPAEEGEQYTLESIMAEFGHPAPPPDESPSGPAYTPEDVAQDQQEKREEAFFFPPKAKKPPEPSKEGKITAFPGVTLVSGGADDEPTRPIPVIREDPMPPPPAEEESHPVDEPTRILDFPSQPSKNPVDRLRRKAGDFADHMFEEEGAEHSEAVRRAEELIPGTDREEAPKRVRQKKVRKAPPPPPDLPPAELHKLYSKGFKSLKARCWLTLFPLAALGYLTWDPALSFLPADLVPLPVPALRCWLMAGLHALAMLFGYDVLWQGFKGLTRGRLGIDAVGAFASVAVLIDALTLPILQPSGTMDRSPFSAVAVLTLWCLMRGNLQKRRGQRSASRAAAVAKEPYLVTRDEGKWNNRDTYAKWMGPVTGFGSQLQSPDGAQRIYRVMAPILLIASLLFSLISSVGRERSQDFFWCLACILSAATPLSATLCYGLPWRQLADKLAKSGAVLAGWPGVVNTTGTSNLILTDIDLFPARAVVSNGIKVYGDVPLERMVSLTATVIRDAHCGLDSLFYDLLRSQGGRYRKGDLFTAYQGGYSEVFDQDLILVGSASFMTLMTVPLPQGLKVKNAVFCAINGELAGIFALNYQLPNTVLPALDILIHNRITPVLGTRDFNLIPSVLRQKFMIPAEKLEFPAVERRMELSDPDQTHSSTLTALLCREGLLPYAEAVVGARRLRFAVRLGTVVSCIGAIVGALLAFYLTFVGGYASLTPFNLLVFLLAWLVPTPFIAGWVDRY